MTRMKNMSRSSLFALLGAGLLLALGFWFNEGPVGFSPVSVPENATLGEIVWLFLWPAMTTAAIAVATIAFGAAVAAYVLMVVLFAAVLLYFVSGFCVAVCRWLWCKWRSQPMEFGTVLAHTFNLAKKVRVFGMNIFFHMLSLWYKLPQKIKTAAASNVVVISCSAVLLVTAVLIAHAVASMHQRNENNDLARAMAEKGDAEAQYTLANAYWHGSGIPNDMDKAEHWFQEAAEQGHVEAQARLGLLTQMGYFSGKDSTAAHWLHKAAEQGHARARVMLGVLYWEDYETAEAKRDAVHWWREGAWQGDSIAQRYLGRAYWGDEYELWRMSCYWERESLGIAADEKEAFREAYIWYSLSDSDALDELKECNKLRNGWFSALLSGEPRISYLYLSPAELRAADEDVVRRREEINRRKKSED